MHSYFMVVVVTFQIYGPCNGQTHPRARAVRVSEVISSGDAGAASFCATRTSVYSGSTRVIYQAASAIGGAGAAGQAHTSQRPGAQC
jgi:hypothetical protein